MKTMKRKKSLQIILCVVLIAAVALLVTGCTGNKPTEAGTYEPAVSGSVLGEGEKSFALTVTDKEGNQTQLTINTNKKTVGEALLDLGLIVGEKGPYGLYIKAVNGITADYDKDGVYWAFYIDGEYAMSGVDTTEIVPGTSYEFKVE